MLVSSHFMIKKSAFAAIALTLLFVLTSIPLTSFAQSSVASARTDAAAGSIPSFGGPCGITISHENHANDAIQLALNKAAEGKISPSTVCVGAGVFPEQLNITSSGDVSLVGLGTSSNPSVIDPASVAVNTYGFISATFAQAAIVLVGNNGSGATLHGINIRNFVIDGDGARSSIDKYPICYADYAGINYNGASGSVVNNTIEDMYLPLDQASCADGGGIDVDINNNLSPAETVDVADNFIPNYGEFGIGCWSFYGSGGMTCDIAYNTMSFYLPYVPLSTGPAGIAVLQGALGIVAHNIASGNKCTDKKLALPCGPNLVVQSQGSGIFTFGSATGTEVEGNIVTNNDLGIEVIGDTTSVFDNVVLNSVDAGIFAFAGSGTYHVAANLVFHTRIGLAVVHPGYLISDSTPFSVRFEANLLLRVPTALEIITLTPGMVTVYYRGVTYVVSGNATVIVK